MRINQKLAKVVLMTVMFSSVIPSVTRAAGEININDSSANPYTVPHFNDYVTNVDGVTNDSYISINGNNDKSVVLEQAGDWISYRTINLSGNGGPVLANSGNGTTTFNGYSFDVDVNATGPVTKGSVIENSGNLVFNNGVYFCQDTNAGAASSAIVNSGNLTFNNNIFANNYYNVDKPTIDNSGTINAIGEMFEVEDIVNRAGGTIIAKNTDFYARKDKTTINNQGTIKVEAEAIDVSAKDDNSVPAIINNGILELKTKSDTGRIFIGNKIENHGDLSINASGGLSLGNGEAGITLVDDRAIDNYGKLTVVGNNNSFISGDIIHRAGAETAITLKSVTLDTYYSSFSGRVYGADDNFSLTLDKSYWVIDKGQPEEVTNVTLNDSYIHIKSDNYDFFEDGSPVYPWNDSYDTLKLKNLSASGESAINICTDLKNNLGDQVVLTGTTPDKLNLMIWNKDDNGGVPIKKEDGHKVRVLISPSASSLNVNSYLGFYNNFGESFAWNPIIETSIDGAEKYWDFVGWNKGNARTYQDELKRESSDTTLLQRDNDTTLRRINDIRTDPSEVGVWVRAEKGDSKIRNYSYDYSIMAGGYDWQKDNKARKLFGGFAVTYSKNKCDEHLIGDAKSMSYSLYGSWLGKKNNDYVDLILKYGKLDKNYAGTDLNNVFVSGDYDKNLLSIAARYGRRIYSNNGGYIEPQIGYTYGKLSGVNFVDSQQAKINSAGINSHVATVGIQVGKKIKGIEYYSKLAYVYDFGGNIRVSSGDTVVEDDMGGGYVRVALGASRKVNKHHSFYCDLEKDFGSKVKKPYSVDLGYRYSF